jgi:hypothetical protein
MSARCLAIRQRGVVLPVVLLIAAMILATSAAWFETSLSSLRGASNARDYLQAFHAADSALTVCARTTLAAAASGNDAPPLASGEPSQWKTESIFEANAVAIAAQWPGSLRSPQCLVEAWRTVNREDARAWLLTARGFGRSRDSQVWLQLELVLAGGTVERHWRRIAARPF